MADYILIPSRDAMPIILTGLTFGSASVVQPGLADGPKPMDGRVVDLINVRATQRRIRVRAPTVAQLERNFLENADAGRLAD